MSFIPIDIRENLVHFIGKRGCTWYCNVTLLQYGTSDPIDLVGYGIRGQIRKNRRLRKKAERMAAATSIPDPASLFPQPQPDPDDTSYRHSFRFGQDHSLTFRQKVSKFSLCLRNLRND